MSKKKNGNTEIIFSEQIEKKPPRIKAAELKKFEPLTPNQAKFFEAYARGDYFTMLCGSAGTGKTFIATYKAIEEVLESQRAADEGNMLWEVFNRVQENIIEGNFEYITKSGKKRQARVIKNFKQDQDVNKKMFSKALEFAA